MQYYCNHSCVYLACLLLLYLSLCIPSSGYCAAAPLPITGCYSSVYYVEEEGDLVGEEICIIPSKSGYYAFYQESSGAPGTPLLAPAQIKGNSIQFLAVPEASPSASPQQIVATITADGLTSQPPTYEFTLPRKPSFWLGDSASLHVTGCYSNLQTGEQKGTLLGYELFIVNSQKGLYVLYQESSGEPAIPQLVPAQTEGNLIHFTIPSRAPHQRQFTGIITLEGLTGRFSNTHETIVLKRKNSYWQ